MIPPDYERESLNRQTTHWYFSVTADAGTHLKVSISKILREVYNGVLSGEWWDKAHPISCYISYDNRNWEPVMTTLCEEREVIADFVMKAPKVYIARLPVYTLENLEALENRYRGAKNFSLIPVGKTLEGRPLEIIRLGDPAAAHSVVMRARAHPWEPGGSWIVEGLVRKFLSENSSDWKKSFCVYIMPMANKDGVERGMTRFNTAGMDLNRKWDRMSDPELCPEKYALEKFLDELASRGIKPELGIDIHNDDAGGINLSTHAVSDKAFLPGSRLLETLMRDRTCFTENFAYSWSEGNKTPGFVLFEDGLLSRWGIESFVWELNANWNGKTRAMPVAADWISSGEGLNEVFYRYFLKKE
jgi:hypothetical protein